MPDVSGTRISLLPAATAVSDTDLLPVAQGNTTKKSTLSLVKAWIKGWIAKGDVGLGDVANVLQYSASNKPTSADVTYDGTASGLSATDVKGAVDELDTRVDALESALDGLVSRLGAM